MCDILPGHRRWPTHWGHLDVLPLDRAVYDAANRPIDIPKDRVVTASGTAGQLIRRITIPAPIESGDLGSELHPLADVWRAHVDVYFDQRGLVRFVSHEGSFAEAIGFVALVPWLLALQAQHQRCRRFVKQLP